MWIDPSSKKSHAVMITILTKYIYVTFSVEFSTWDGGKE